MTQCLARSEIAGERRWLAGRSSPAMRAQLVLHRTAEGLLPRFPRVLGAHATLDPRRALRVRALTGATA